MNTDRDELVNQIALLCAGKDVGEVWGAGTALAASVIAVMLTDDLAQAEVYADGFANDVKLTLRRDWEFYRAQREACATAHKEGRA